MFLVCHLCDKTFLGTKYKTKIFKLVTFLDTSNNECSWTLVGWLWCWVLNPGPHECSTPELHPSNAPPPFETESCLVAQVARSRPDFDPAAEGEALTPVVYMHFGSAPSPSLSALLLWPFPKDCTPLKINRTWLRLSPVAVLSEAWCDAGF